MTEPDRYPLLLLPEPTEADREKMGSGQGRRNVRRPTAAEQGERLGGKWATLQRAIEERSADILPEVAGQDPELVLVLEIMDDVADFYRAVAQIEGFEYLAELDEIDVDTQGAFIDANDANATFDGTLFMVASNQQALSAVLDLWRQYQEDEQEPFPRNFGRWKELFRLLIDVRRWSPQDRLRGTGVVEDFRRRAEVGAEVVPAEIELWFRSDAQKRAAGERSVREAVERAGGRVIRSATVSEIAYHAVLVTLPIGAVQPLLGNQPEDIELIRAEAISFLRPESQGGMPIIEAELKDTVDRTGGPALGTAEPLVAVLDGLPLSQHLWLRDWVAIDDPDSWEGSIQASHRQHGTAVSSLVAHGDGNAANGRRPRRGIYARPVLTPTVGLRGTVERIPPDQLPVDLIFRAVRRMYEGDGDGEPTAPSVRLINLSVGDAAAQLATTLSPWARLLDWLAYRYRVLFVISSGNHFRPISLPITPGDLGGLADDKLRACVLRELVAESASRRILSPSESVNSLCVGASHDDESGTWVQGSRTDLLRGSASGRDALPSAITAIGMGYKRSVKPDILAPGGRVLFRVRPSGSTNAPVVLDPLPAGEINPGLLVAAPSSVPGALDRSRHFTGTSGAAAIVSHHGALVLDSLTELGQEDSRIDQSYLSVLTKALLVHTARLPASASEVRAAFNGIEGDRLKDAVSRLYGYGILDSRRLLGGARNRVSLLGFGSLKNEQADRYEVPLPPSLAGRTVRRRLSVTLAYLTPIRLRDRRHRAYELYFKPDQAKLRLSRQDSAWRTVKRGTVQHEVLEGRQSAAFVDGDSLALQVNCRSLVGAVGEPALYGLVVSLEVEPNTGIAVYDEVATRVRQRSAAARVRS